MCRDKVQSAPTPNLKEKYEADLKREIKKLQRLRDSCKVFIAQHEVKNKNPLIEVRKQIEEKMEQFKVLEKQTKTKAYSKEGLAASAKQRPAGGAGGEDDKREEVKGWLDEMSEALQGQYDEMEHKLETAKETGNMKSKKKAKGSVTSTGGESVEDIQRVMDRQQFHMAQIELIKERLDEDGVTADEVEGLRDGLENYVNNHLEADFEEDEALYDELDLAEREEGAEEEEEQGKEEKEEEAEQTAGEDKEKEGETYSPTKGKIASVAAAPVATGRPTINVNARTTGVIQTSKTPTAAASSPIATAAAASTTKSTSPPTTAATTPITRITPTAATPAAGKPALSITPLPAGGKKAVAAAAPAPVTTAPIAPVKPMESMASIVMKGTGKVDEQRRSAAVTNTITPITPITAIAPAATTTAAAKPPLSVTNILSATATKPAAAAATTASRVEQGRPPLIAPVMKINTSSASTTSSAAANTASTPTSASQPASAASSAPSFHSPPVSPAPLPAAALSSPSVASSPSTAPPSRPSSSASILVPDDSASVASSVATIGSSISVSPPTLSLSSASSVPPFDSTGYTFASAVPQSTTASTTSPTASNASLSTSSFSAVSHTPSAHRDRGLIPDDYFSTLQLLDASLHHFPQPADTDRPKPYTPRNPYRTPPYFPSTPPAIFDDPQLFSHLTVDTLFFIFYFQQGTPHQYLAARELKKQSWRYHKNFLTWFQRHDDPKLTSDEYETGTYVYFDYESGWCQRIKAEFTFEYRHLECEDIEGIASQVTQFGRA